MMASERPQGAPLLELTGLRKSFGGVAAVDGISFAVAPGEIVALIAYLMRLGRNLEPANKQGAVIEGGK